MDYQSMKRRIRIPATHLSRRGAIAFLGGMAVGVPHTAAAQATPTVDTGTQLPLVCEPCVGAANAGACCIPGLTGGGVLQLESRQAQVVVFAMRLDGNAAQQAAGFVRWTDERWQDSRLILESIGPITYKPVEGDDQARDIRGIMQANGAGEFAFHLRLVDYGPGHTNQDTAHLTVSGLATTLSASGGPDYDVQGMLVGGDFQLLNSVAPIG